MKKIFLTVAVAATMLAVNAQDMMSKRGFPILPEAGDWSIGFDAIPLLNYAGNFINHNANYGDAHMSPQRTMTIVGLYVVDAETAYRGRVGINFGSTDHTLGSVPDSLRDPSETKVSSNIFTLGFGIQKTRGKGRLHGIYGAELDLTFGGTVDSTLSYAKALAATDFVTRVTEDKTGSVFGIGLNGFIGAEYFFAAKMSLSAEYMWGLNLTSVSAGTLTTETANGTTVTTTSITGAKNSSFNLGVTDAGAIVFHLYF